MAGLFDDFDIDIDEVKEAGGFDFEDGFYDFTISEVLRQQGTKKEPDDTKLIIKYDLDEAGVYWEWFTIAVDGDADHSKAKQSLGFLKSRLIDLGYKPAELKELDVENDLEGIQGTLELRTTSGKGKNASNKYQNVRNVKVATDDEPEEEEEAEPEPAPEAAAKRRVAERQAARQTPKVERTSPNKATPTRRRAAVAAPADDEDDENPFG